MKTVRFHAILTLCMLAACSNKENLPSQEEKPIVPEKLPIQLSVNCNSIASRVEDSNFENNDAIGLYVVNYNKGEAGSLKPSGNHVDNMRFRYSNHNWAPDEEIYWKDNQTPADFYAYYPYTTSMQDITAWPITVFQNQSSEDTYKKSEYLYGKATRIQPTEKAVQIKTSHILSNMVITLKPGNGFTEEKLEAADVKVAVNGLKTQASYNLSNGQFNELTGMAQTCTPWYTSKEYRLMVIPQKVEEQQFITVTIDGKDYNLTKGFTFEGGKRYKFPITVNKTSNGINVGINPWEDDDIDHGGVAE